MQGHRAKWRLGTGAQGEAQASGRGEGKGGRRGRLCWGTLGRPGSRRGGAADRTDSCPRGPHRQEGPGAGLSPGQGKEGPPGPESAGSWVRAGARGGSWRQGQGQGWAQGQVEGLGKSLEGKRRELTYFSKKVKCQSPTKVGKH